MDKKQKKEIVSRIELTVLHALRERFGASVKAGPEGDATAELVDLATSTGIRDNDEVLRALYTLEGKNLVSPEPPGDLTSSLWRITDGGMKALNFLQQ